MEEYTINIDEKKCTKCGLCSEDCISGCIKFENGRPALENMQWCSLCGHCIAVCPAACIKHSGLDSKRTHVIDYSKIKSDVYREIAESRRSVRRFKDKAVPQTEIEDILNLASYSPTASNTMDVCYTVISDKEKIAQTGTQIYAMGERIIRFLQKPYGKWLIFIFNKLSPRKNISRYIDRYEIYNEWIAAGRNVVTHNAPVLILVQAPKSRFGAINSAIAATNITNYAHAKGLGTCYIGFINVALDHSRKLKKNMQVPDGYKVYAALIFGYPAYKHKRTAPRPACQMQWIGKK